MTIEGLLERGAEVVAHDPEAMEEARRRFGERMAEPAIVDGRNLYPPETMREEGFEYYSVGRPAVGAESG